MFKVKFGLRLYFCNYYRTLKVDQDASLNEIKQSFLNLAKKHHPDYKQISDDQFIKIKQAYDTLRDPDLRKQYDYNLIHGDPNSQHRKYQHYYSPNSVHNIIYQKFNIYRFIGQIGMFCIFVYLIKLFLVPMTQHQIRRQNLILSRQNWDSSPSTQEKRRKMFEKQWKQKKISSRVIDVKVSNGSQQSTKAKNVRKNGLQSIPGVKKQVKLQALPPSQQYI